MTLVVTGGRVVTAPGAATADVAIADGTITDIGPRLRGDETLDAGGCHVMAGFVDLQVNGGFGDDFTTDPASIWKVGRRLPEHGVTAFAPTIITSRPDRVDQALDVVAAGPPAGYRGARVLGLHLEGPYLAPTRRGVHPEEYLRRPNVDEVTTWAPPVVRIVTLAPELPGAEDVTRALHSQGVVVSAGHSDADWETLMDAKSWGVTHGTHLFNGMSGCSHRDPGLAAFLMADPDLTCGLIVDGVHSHPGSVRLAWQAKGPEGIGIVTDAIAGLGLGDGTHQLGALTITCAGGVARAPTGQLAGAVTPFDAMVRNLLAITGCSLEEAAAAASATAAAVLGEATLGRIAVGAAGDLTLLDGDLEVAATVVAGSVVYRRGSH
ncbi:MAG TPA: N-acetylglucosamine-6-phosphate deacetylase [Acidimicrobiia bacterium]|jgi:N-acetylglucosamine-6-phosphate deacetylase